MYLRVRVPVGAPPRGKEHLVTRAAGAVVGLGLAALLMAYWAFGWPALLAGAPLLVGTVLVVVAVLASEGPRRRMAEQRAARFDPSAQLPRGLMSGFFEAAAPASVLVDYTAGVPRRLDRDRS